MSFAVIDPNPAAAVRTDAAWLDAHWMPFTGNRNFKAKPRMIVSGQGAYYTDAEGRKIFDGLSGLWCSGLGHGRKEVAEAILRYLYRAGQRPVSRETLLQEVWGYNSGVTTHTLETHIYRLRQKVEKDATTPSILVTEAGGYKLVP